MFQARHVSTGDNEEAAGLNATGNIDNATLLKIKKIWQHYRSATTANNQNPIVITPRSAWLTAAVDGGETDLNGDVPASYTQAIHESVLASAGIAAADYNQYLRTGLLYNWVTVETNGTHWGSATPYRMVEGGGDEFGSAGFNQVLFQYRYGTTPIGVHRDSDYNYYKPDENLLGFIVHTSASAAAADHTGPFHNAFVRLNQARQPHLSDAYAANTVTEFRGYRHCNNDAACANTAITLRTAIRDDVYERLARAIARYNSNTNNIDISWPDIMRNRTPANCHGCKYSVSVRNENFGLPYRQYIWLGGKVSRTRTRYDSSSKGQFQLNRFE